MADLTFSGMDELIKSMEEADIFNDTIQEKLLLAGAEQLRIFVPREAYHLYRDGYGCEENVWTVWLDRIEVF